MNYDENLTYDWLKSLREKLIKEDDATAKTNQCPQEYPLAASQNSRYAALYGDFCYKELSGGKIEIQPPWEQENITTITLNNRNYQINKYIAKHFVDTYDAAAQASGYRPPLSGIYNARHVEGGGLSAHAWGMAIDFDAGRNPWIKDQNKNLENPSKMDQNKSFISTFEANHFVWLGTNEEHPQGVGDDMHFYYGEKTDAAGPTFVGAVGGATGDSFGQQDFSDWRKYFSPFLSKIIPDSNPIASVVTPVQLNEGTSDALTDDQIAKLCYDVGWRGEDLVTAVRIVMGESGGVPTQRNDGLNKDGTVDRGLFQLNSYWFREVPDEEAFDAIKNAQHAFRSYQKRGFKAWEGPTNFHTLKKDKITKQMVPDTDKIERAKNAVQRLTGYVSTGNFEYLGGANNQLASQQTNTAGTKQYSDWKSYSRPFLSKIIPDDNPLASISQQADPTKQFLPDNPLNEIKVLSKKNKFKILDKTNDKRISKYKKLLFSMLPYYDERLKLSKPVKIIFVDDKENANNPLGRTAFYAPEKMSITVYTTNRFIKDILRSLGHELIHHKQHCIDEFSDMPTPEGYAQKNKKLRKKEEEAYLFGNMLFRDWEDKYKSKHKKEL